MEDSRVLVRSVFALKVLHPRAARWSRSALAAMAGAFFAGVPFPAHADEGEICLADSIQGQVLRKSGRLLRAHEHFAACAREACDAPIRDKCAAWLRESDAETPRVVLRVVDDRGATLPVRLVHVDGVETRIDGPVALDPGRHTVRADFAGRTGAIDLDAAPSTREAKVVVDLRATRLERPIPAATYVFGGAAIVGAAVATAFGVSALVQKGHLEACAPFCPSDRRAPLERATLAADVSGGLAIAAALGAAIVYLARPTVSREVRVGAEGVSWTF